MSPADLAREQLLACIRLGGSAEMVKLYERKLNSARKKLK